MDLNTWWPRARVFHPALAEVNDKFSGDCNGAGCGLRCFIQSLSNQLAFLLILPVVRSGPQTAKDRQSLWSGACWTQKLAQGLASPWGIWLLCLYYRKTKFWRDLWRKRTVHVSNAWLWIIGRSSQRSPCTFLCAWWQLNGTAIAVSAKISPCLQSALCVVGTVNDWAEVPSYLNCIDFPRSYSLMQGMTYCPGSHRDEILQQHSAGTWTRIYLALGYRNTDLPTTRPVSYKERTEPITKRCHVSCLLERALLHNRARLRGTWERRCISAWEIWSSWRENDTA